jgi:hypothetical protein
MSTDGPHGLPGGDGVAHQVDHGVAQPDAVGGEASGNDDGVDVGDADRAGRDLGGDLLTLAAAVDAALDGTHDLHGRAGAGQGRPRRVEVEVVVVLFHQDHHAPAAQRSRFVHADPASVASVLQRS